MMLWTFRDDSSSHLAQVLLMILCVVGGWILATMLGDGRRSAGGESQFWTDNPPAPPVRDRTPWVPGSAPNSRRPATPDPILPLDGAWQPDVARGIDAPPFDPPTPLDFHRGDPDR